MTIEFIEKEQIWQEEQTRYWFLVDGEEFCIADTNGETQLLGSDGCPIEDCNDHNRVKAALIPEYKKRTMD
jgi:hypothetical protein